MERNTTVNRIGRVTLKNEFLLAPLAGITDVGFRRLSRNFGAALSCTEMVSCKGLNFDNKNSEGLLYTADNEKPVAVQLFGNDEADFERAIRSGKLDKFDIIDINMGCPVPKIVKNGAGSYLMTDMPRAERIISAAVKSTDKPITVKFRLGYTERNKNAAEFAKMCEGAGAAMVTVHGRTKEQMYSGTADYREIEKVVSAVKIPVCGNGDVFSKAKADELKNLGCAFVMVARGCLGKPWIFAELQNKAVSVNRFAVMREHFSVMKQFYGEEYSAVNMRKHFSWYLRDFRGASKYRNEINQLKTEEEILNLLDEIERTTNEQT